MDDWTALSDVLPDLAVRLGAAVICGLLLGLERERKDKPAGLRTILLITVGSTLYMIVSSLVPLAAGWPSDVTRVDPGRIAAQVVTGIGFLGAGTIIQARGAVHGLTTAAVIWVAAGIGLCSGLGFPGLALGVTLLVLAILVAMDPLRRWLSRFGPRQEVTILAPDDTLVLDRVRYLLQSQDIPPREIRMERTKDGEIRVDFGIHVSSDAATRILSALSTIEGVHGPRYGDDPSGPARGRD